MKAHFLGLTSKKQKLSDENHDKLLASLREKNVEEVKIIISRMRIISLGDKEIGDEEVRVLSEAMKDNTSVIILNLPNNKITDTGVEYIAQMIIENKTLGNINLVSNNGILYGGLMAISKALKQNSSITYLGLENDYIKDHAQDLIKKFLDRNVEEKGRS